MEAYNPGLVANNSGLPPASGASVEELLAPWHGTGLTTDIPGIDRVVLSGFTTQRDSSNSIYNPACGLDPVFRLQIDADLDIEGTSDVGTFRLTTTRGPGDANTAADIVSLRFSPPLNAELEGWLAAQQTELTFPLLRVRGSYEDDWISPNEPMSFRLDVVDLDGETWIFIADAHLDRP